MASADFSALRPHKWVRCMIQNPVLSLEPLEDPCDETKVREWLDNQNDADADQAQAAAPN